MWEFLKLCILVGKAMIVLLSFCSEPSANSLHSVDCQLQESELGKELLKEDQSLPGLLGFRAWGPRA